MESWLEPLYDAAGIRAIDAWAIERQGVPSERLMEAAAGKLAEAVAGLSPQGPIRVLCGKGNNGGDGEIAARKLERLGFEVEVARLFDAGAPDDFDAWLAGSGAVVDAIFGTGFSGVPREPAAAAIAAINRCPAPVVACDIASGVDASSGEIAAEAVEAELTVSFHAAKVGQWVAPGKWHTG
ncbi:MAG: ADP-dependent NAD(P)H-hydrate dehydratase / NAD(P)H-hydrate epimerase, partial [Solirubrobacterales bacterium]|nr:ADP-dependent NAD(P)H-hydrate dehydratase / NAD(P)H-hydrate epimerase [Solirubrobacterales bacterium]